MTTAEHRESIRIPASHPALPGHFPGNPLVPGVVLLDWVAAALARWRGVRIAALPQVKFLAPLRPEQEAQLVLADAGATVRFAITHAGTAIASGAIETGAIEGGR